MIKNELKINLLDLAFLTTLILSTIGFALAKADKTSLNNIIQGKENITIKVLLPDVYSENGDLFKVGEKTSITIRNRPYTKLAITNIESLPKQKVISSASGTYKVIKDPTRTKTIDYIVTIKDEALKTKDGYVIGGNKIKIGNQIELEGFKYRLNGKVVGINAAR